MPCLPPSPLMLSNHPSIRPNIPQWCPHSCLRDSGYRDTCQSLSLPNMQKHTNSQTPQTKISHLRQIQRPLDYTLVKSKHQGFELGIARVLIILTYLTLGLGAAQFILWTELVSLLLRQLSFDCPSETEGLDRRWVWVGHSWIYVI